MEEDRLSIIEAQSRIIQDYKNLIFNCLALMYCVIEDEIPKYEAGYRTCKLEKRFHEITYAYQECIKPDADRIPGRNLQQILKDLGLDPPGDK